jgi:hypothetical protein
VCNATDAEGSHTYVTLDEHVAAVALDPHERRLAQLAAAGASSRQDDDGKAALGCDRTPLSSGNLVWNFA